MSYTKTTWSDGDVITAEKLNNIENGVESANSSGSILIVYDINGVLDKTWEEIYNSMTNGTPSYCYAEYEDSINLYPVIAAFFYPSDNIYIISCVEGTSYQTSSYSGYPEFVSIS